MTGPTRREALAWIALLAAGTTMLPGRGASAESRPRLKRFQESDLGLTLWLELDHAPFPSGRAPWKDPTVIVFVPARARFGPEDPLEMVVYFHGIKTTAAAVLERHGLREQLHGSGKNAILVIPQGPVNADDCRGGKLDRQGGLRRMLGELRETLTTWPLDRTLAPWGLTAETPPGRTVLAAHSGGFRTTAHSLDRGEVEVSEVYLFAALYGDTDLFLRWLDTPTAHTPRRLISYHDGDSTTENTRNLIHHLRERKIPYRYASSSREVRPEEFVRDQVIFLRTWASHDKVALAGMALRNCLEASALRDVPELRGAGAEWAASVSGERAPEATTAPEPAPDHAQREPTLDSSAPAL